MIGVTVSDRADHVSLFHGSLDVIGNVRRGQNTARGDIVRQNGGKALLRDKQKRVLVPGKAEFDLRYGVLRVGKRAAAQIAEGPFIQIDGVGAFPVLGDAVSAFIDARRAERHAQVAHAVLCRGGNEAVARLVVRACFNALRILIIILRIQVFVDEAVGRHKQTLFLGVRPP